MSVLEHFKGKGPLLGSGPLYLSLSGLARGRWRAQKLDKGSDFEIIRG
jgi:hypothetical protein